jgi:hypothetical protein
LISKLTFHLPLSVFDVVRSFFVNFSIDCHYDKISIQEWRYFCNCSHSFHEIKQYHVYYDLNLHYSCAYLSYNDQESFKSLKFGYDDISRLLAIVNNSKQQVLLHFKRPIEFLGFHLATEKLRLNCNPLYLTSIDDSFVKKYKKQIESVHSIEWREGTAITDVSSFRTLFYLDLRESQDIRDDSCLANVKVLCLAGCSEATYIHKLENCQELDVSNTNANLRFLVLSGCDQVKDVSTLKNLHSLYSDGCLKVIDVSILSNVPLLSLRNMENLKKGLLPDNKNSHSLLCKFLF